VFEEGRAWKLVLCVIFCYIFIFLGTTGGI
jgi:hypothetical protein